MLCSLTSTFLSCSSAETRHSFAHSIVGRSEWAERAEFAREPLSYKFCIVYPLFKLHCCRYKNPHAHGSNVIQYTPCPIRNPYLYVSRLFTYAFCIQFFPMFILTKIWIESVVIHPHTFSHNNKKRGLQK